MSPPSSSISSGRSMFKCIVLLLASLAVATAYVIVPIIRHDQDIKYDGNYFFNYETGDGISHEATGTADEVKGHYKYTAPDGTPIEVTYVAGVNGFQPYGSHIPAVPEYVTRALEYIRTHPPKDDPYNPKDLY